VIITRTQIYTGDGKGKTTAAFGLALRAVGHGMKVIVIQFLKGGNPSGEVVAARRFGLFDVESFGAEDFYLPIEESAEHLDEALNAVNRVRELLVSGEYDIVIADEIVTAMHLGLISEDDVVETMNVKPLNTELILTGRGATQRIIDEANLVTEMREIKHYFSDGVPAREGIEK